MTTTTKRLGIDQITAASELQARETLSEDAIADYAGIYSADNGNATLPPIRVVWDQSTETYWLVDGWHRLYGAKRAKVAKLSCEVINGTKAFAILEACGANDEHGVRRTNADKRKAVRMLLENPDWANKPNTWIAQHARVGDHLVASVRESVQPRENEVEQPKRKSRDGKQRPASSKAAADTREAVARVLEENPDATVREIAEETGASVGTVQAVKTTPPADPPPYNKTHGPKWRGAFGTLQRMSDDALRAGVIDKAGNERIQADLRAFLDEWESATGMLWINQ